MPAGDKGMGKGERERAEVSRSRAATSHLSCRRGRSWRAGGRWRAKSPSLLPPPFSVGMLLCPHPPPPPPPPPPSLPPMFKLPPLFLIPISYLLYFSHNELFRHLTDALTGNDRISFTSSTAGNYERKGQGLQCRQRSVTTE